MQQILISDIDDILNFTVIIIPTKQNRNVHQMFIDVLFRE